MSCGTYSSLTRTEGCEPGGPRGACGAAFPPHQAASAEPEGQGPCSGGRPVDGGLGFIFATRKTRKYQALCISLEWRLWGWKPAPWSLPTTARRSAGLETSAP